MQMAVRADPTELPGLIYARVASIKIPSLDALVYSAAGLAILLIGSWAPDERLNLAGLPVNVLVLTAVVLFATTGKVPARVWPAFLLLQVPLLLLAVSLMWSPDPTAGLNKLTTLLISTTAAFVCFSTVIEKHGERELLRLLLFFFSVLLASAIAYKLVFGFFIRSVPFFINGAIVFGRLMCIAALLALFCLEGTLRKVAVLAFALAVLWTESKGPILALFICLLALAYWKTKPGYRLLIIAAVLALVAALAGGANYYGVEARDLGRLGVLYGLMTGDTDVLETGLATGSVQTRFEMWADTLPLIFERPLGVGLGGWSYSMDLLMPTPYPHNIFLELWSEAGIVIGTFAALPFMLFLLQRNRAPFWYIALMLLIAQLVSGDLGDARFLLTFGFLSMLSRP